MDFENYNIVNVNSEVSYDKSKIIGKGTYGTVYRGHHIKYHIPIAVKVIPNGKYREDGEGIRQAMLMIHMSQHSHPNILKFLGYQKTQDKLYYFTEYCEKGSLKKCIQEGIDEAKIVSYFKQILQAFIFLKKHNVLHRDVKPDNILLTENDEIKLGDFGSARFRNKEMTQGAKCCTPLYAPPEFLLSNKISYDERCDVWSTGVILYEMLCKKKLFDVYEREHLYKLISKFQTNSFDFKFPQSINDLWKVLVKRILIYEESQRPTFKELIKAFEEIETVVMKESLDKKNPRLIELTSKITKSSLSDLFNENPEEEEKVQANKFSSVVLLNKVKQYIRYIQRKDDIIERLRERLKHGYEVIGNIHKSLLTFLIYSAQIAKINKIQEQIKCKRLFLPSGEVVVEDRFVREDRKEFKTVLMGAEQILEEIAQKRMQSLEKISQKIVDKYAERKTESKILDEFEEISCLVQIFKGTKSLFEENVYRNGLQFLTQSPKFDPSLEVLEKYSPGDVQTFAYIILIRQFNRELSDEHFREEDLLNQKVDLIEKSSKNINLKTIADTKTTKSI